ncbi:MAG: SH3 domain-containing protein [Clostridia bacterium]|nr:SH3 domain-containing protein [Clostridia bacterium]
MKKRVLVLFLCMLFLAGTALAVVPRSGWSDDPDYYSELGDDLSELDDTTLYTETEDVYDSGDSYGGSYDDSYGGSYDDSYGGSYDDDNSFTTDSQVYEDTGDTGEGQFQGNTSGEEPDTPSENQPVVSMPIGQTVPDTTDENDENGTIVETDNQPEVVVPGQVNTPPDVPEPADPEITVTIGTENEGGTSGGGTFGDDFYDDEIDYEFLLRQYDEIQTDDDTDIVLYPEEIPYYIIVDNPLYFIDETIEPDPVQYPDDLASLIETDTRRYPYRARVATRGGRLNVRSGPSTGYHVVGLIPNGSLVIVYGRSTDLNWAYVVCENGLQGFVLDAYLTTRNIFRTPAPTPTPVITPELSITGQVEFKATGLDGAEYLSTDFFDHNYVTMINVWATSSSASVKEMEALQELASQLNDTHVAIVGICEDAVDADSIAKANQILNEKGVTFTNLMPPANMDEILPVRGYPTTYFVDYNGNVWGAPIEGAYPDAFVDRLIEITNILR